MASLLSRHQSARFFVCRYLKDRAFQQPIPRNVHDMKDRITRTLKEIPVEVFPRVMSNDLTRSRAVIGKRGGFLPVAV